MNIIDEINTLIKKYAPRPYFTSQKHLEDIIQNESLTEVKADFVMDEWVIGHITEIIEKYQQPKTGHWIPVGERLPEVGIDVLVSDADSDIYFTHITRDGVFFDEWGNKIKGIVAWMPLPKPYEL